MSKDNPISKFVQWYTKNGPNPLFTALLLGLGTYGAGKVAWGPSVETLRAIGRPIGKRMFGSDDDWNKAMDNLKADSSFAKWVPRGIGLLAAGLAAYSFYMPNQSKGGLLDWYPGTIATPLPSGATTKIAAFDDAEYVNTQVMSMNPYVTEMDWNRTINASNVVDLFKKDPHLADAPYARNTGIAIVSDASISNHTRNPSLGNIFDSAVNKIENKLSFGGLTNVAVKTAVANGVSRLFASSVGAMMGLSPQARQNLIDAGTWAGAITSMLQ